VTQKNKKVNTAFILMPFNQSFNDVYILFIKATLENVGYKVVRVDDITSQQSILSDIIQGIESADLVVADLTDLNANVFYELGIAHALDKDVILLTQAIEEIPFDLRSYRVLEYSVHFAKIESAKQQLKELATKAINNEVVFGNPVRDYVKKNSREVVESVADKGRGLEVVEKGLIDRRIDIEENLEHITNIISDVSDSLEELNPKIHLTSSVLNDQAVKLTKKRNSIKLLADHIEQVSENLKASNIEYSDKLSVLNDDLEFVLQYFGAPETDEEKADAESFLDAMRGMELSSIEGATGFEGMLESMKGIPKLESSFDRSNKYMQSETSELIGNIKATTALAQRVQSLIHRHMS